MYRFLLLACASLLLCACQNGTVTVSVADAPIDGASQAVFRFTGIELIENDGSAHTFEFDPPQNPNLLATTKTQLLGTATVPAADYRQIILHIVADGSVANSFVTYPATATAAAQTLALELPDQDTEGIEVDATFSVTRLRNTALTVDFDLRKAIRNRDDDADVLDLVLDGTSPGNIRVVNDEDVGTLTGAVAANLVSESSGCAPAAVYVYGGPGVTPDDEGGSTTVFSSTTLPSAGTGAVTVSYTIDDLPPGAYTIALLCDAAADDPATNDNVQFLSTPRSVSISAGVTTTADTFQ